MIDIIRPGTEGGMEGDGTNEILNIGFEILFVPEFECEEAIRQLHALFPS